MARSDISLVAYLPTSGKYCISQHFLVKVQDLFTENNNNKPSKVHDLFRLKKKKKNTQLILGIIFSR